MRGWIGLIAGALWIATGITVLLTFVPLFPESGLLQAFNALTIVALVATGVGVFVVGATSGDRVGWSATLTARLTAVTSAFVATTAIGGITQGQGDFSGYDLLYVAGSPLFAVCALAHGVVVFVRGDRRALAVLALLILLVFSDKLSGLAASLLVVGFAWLMWGRRMLAPKAKGQ